MPIDQHDSDSAIAITTETKWPIIADIADFDAKNLWAVLILLSKF